MAFLQITLLSLHTVPLFAGLSRFALSPRTGPLLPVHLAKEAGAQKGTATSRKQRIPIQLSVAESTDGALRSPAS